MQSANSLHRARPLAVAVRSALALLPLLAAATAARADDVSALTHPTNSIELGATYTDQSSAKFGEYNGLYRSGLSLLGNVSISGGDGYDGGTRVWSITGTDLGTTSRSVDASVGDQGSWKLGLSFDQLRHEITDSYQTPLQGSMGGNVFTLPQSFGVVGTKRPATAVPYGTQALTANQKSFFHTDNVYSERQTTGFTASHALGPDWDLRFNWKHDEQSGAKLISSATDVQAIANGFTLAGYAPGGEFMQTVMNPTAFRTDNFDLSLNWAGERGYFTGSFFSSQFRDANSALYFPNPSNKNSTTSGAALGAPFPMNALSLAPDNNDNQINLSGGYNLSPRTKLVGGLSYGRNTQNMGYVYEAVQTATNGVPVSSLNGLVVNTHADWRLTHRATDALTLAAGMVYNKRDNQTPSYWYTFYPLGDPTATTALNIPLSNSNLKSDVTADYKLSRAQSLRVKFENTRIGRWCDNAAANTAAGAAASNGATIPGGAPPYTSTSCVQVPSSVENQLDTTWRLRSTDTLNLNAGLVLADRKANVVNTFYNPMQSEGQGYENLGYIAYFDASRRQEGVKGGLNWQPNAAWTLGIDGRFAADQYYDTTLGVQNGHSSNVNVDASYQIDTHTTASAYVSYQWRRRQLATEAGSDILTTIGPNFWSNTLTDKGTTVGFTAKHGGMLGGRLVLTADLAYSLDTSRYETALGYTNAACTAPSTSGYVCGAVPDIRSETFRVKFTGVYALDKKSSLLMGYLYEKLNTNDYYYNYYQLGYSGETTMPTNQVSPNYSQNVVFVAYRYTFQ